MQPAFRQSERLIELRRLIARADGQAEARHSLPFGVEVIDAALPSRGLPLGAVHEVCEAGDRGHYGANAALFIAGILARLPGPVLWCLHCRDLFAPALARVGLHPDRVIYCETWRDKEILPAMEEGLRHRGIAGVVGELNRLPLTASRRLQLGAEKSGALAFVIRRTNESASEANAAFTRWRISAVASFDTEPIGLSRQHWLVELVRCRGAEGNSWVLEACNAQGYLGFPKLLGDRSLAPERRRASA